MGTPAMFAALFPEFGGEPQARVDAFLTIAAKVVGVPWGSLRQEGIVWLAAHMLAVANQGQAGDGNAAGPVTSRKAGDLSVSYGQIGGLHSSDAVLATTSYGRTYLALRATRALRPVSV